MQLSSGMSPIDIYQKLLKNIETVIHGQRSVIRLVLAGFAGGGHILLEDNPGTGKTTLAKALARSIGTGFKRIQFTPDLLPSDILGVSIFDPRENRFRLHKGPIFTNILLADEINRASPRTQSALLEAMAEKQVSIEGRRIELEKLFFVIATQNSVESRGTYPIPEAQMDRFAMQLSLGYIRPEEEVRVITDQDRGHPIENVAPCITEEDIACLTRGVADIHISEELKHYIVALVSATRSARGVMLGASPRASITLMKTAKALALFDGLDYVTPDHIQEPAVKIIAHRIAIDPQARFAGIRQSHIAEEILRSVPVPA